VVIAPRIEQSYRVRFDECSADGNLRSSGYLRYVHDLAWLHSEQAGLGRDWYAARRLTWLIRALELDVVGEAAYGSTLAVSTEVLGFRRAWARRRSEVTEGEGQRVLATALIDWILLDQGGRPTRIPAEILEAFDARARGGFTPLRTGLTDTPPHAPARQFTPRWSELDPMGHVNNAAHLDYVDEQLADAGRSVSTGRHPRRYRIEYAAPVEHGLDLTAYGWADDLAWCYRLCDAAGRDLVRARVETDPATWVGG
jgi:medium-chain acyl-[acyl-carrier-protein] hydrolase